MKAAVLYGRKDIRYDEIEMPVIKKDEILVKVNVTESAAPIYQECWVMLLIIILLFWGMNSPVKW